MSKRFTRREWIIGASSFAAGAAAPALWKAVSRASRGPVSGFAKELRGSIVRITLTAPPTGVGSGFCIATGADGTSIIATASHVVDGNRINRLVEDASSNRVFAADGTAGPMLVPCCHENWMDVCGFHSGLKLRPMRLAEELPETGAAVMALGFSGGETYDAAEGRFLGLEVDGSCRIRVSARIVPGFSGGPIVNTKGEVIGMSVTFRADGSASHGVPLHELRNLRDRMRFIDDALSPS